MKQKQMLTDDFQNSDTITVAETITLVEDPKNMKEKGIEVEQLEMESGKEDSGVEEDKKKSKRRKSLR